MSEIIGTSVQPGSEPRTVIAMDGWSNLFTGLGVTGRDKRLETIFSSDTRLSEGTLAALYRSNGFARRIVDLVTGEMVRKWFEIDGDPDGEILKYFEKIEAKTKIANLLRWSRLYGGSLGVVLVDDGQGDLAKPINDAAIKSIAGINVFDRYRVTWSTDDLYQDPANPNFQEPEFYRVTPLGTGNEFRVHESRCLRFDGARLPDRERYANQGWGDSELQRVYDRLRALGAVYAGTEMIVEDFVQAVLRIDGLTQKLAAGQENLILQRLHLIDMSRHIANLAILDKEEEYEKKSSSVTGLPDIIDRFVLSLAAASEIPVTLLMGQSPAGLSATGDADIRYFYDSISAKQEEKLNPPMGRLIQLVSMAKDGPDIKEDEGTIAWHPLWQLTDEEEAKMRLTIAQADKIYIETGTLDPDEIAESRFGGDNWSMETTIDVEERTASRNIEEKVAAPPGTPAVALKQ